MERPNISTHISYKEAVNSAVAIKNKIANTPNDKELKAMKELAEKVFEPLRAHIGAPIVVSSFFRSKKLNQAVGGSSTSQHVLGEAIDLVCTKGFTNKDMFDYIKDNLVFDQLIWEFGDDKEPAWIHVSYTTTRANRRMVLKASKINKKTVYTKM